jgi:hypothetical protein
MSNLLCEYHSFHFLKVGRIAVGKMVAPIGPTLVETEAVSDFVHIERKAADRRARGSSVKIEKCNPPPVGPGPIAGAGE